MTELMRQEAPYPTILADLVKKCSYRPHWRIDLADIDRGQGSKGLTLRIWTHGYNSYNTEQDDYSVVHYMIVPAASYNYESWKRWLLEQFLLVERHEACEFFKIGTKRSFAPHHGPGNDPYIIFHHGADIETRTMFTGEVKEKK